MSTTTTLRRGLRVAAVCAVAAAVLLPTAAEAAVPMAPVRLPRAIEGFATYQKQTTCSPTPKPGAVKLKNLLLRTYPGTRSLGIGQSCSVKGTSEHKEGRAFDWGVRYSNPSERAKAQAFLTWLLRTDSAGHRAANARRLGVMYVIWNRRIWGAYADPAGWRPYTGPNPHTDHVHISLSRAGGAGTTSFWTGRVNNTATTPTSGTPGSGGFRPPVPAPDPVPAPAPVPVPIVEAPTPTASLPPGPPLEDESVDVAPTVDGAMTTAALQQGQTYRVEVRGTWQWDHAPGDVADAECSTTAWSDWWPDRTIARASGDQLGLYLDGHDLALSSYGGSSCATSSHTYVTTLTAQRTGRVPLRVWEPAAAAAYADNTGSLRVRLIHDVARDTLPVRVDTHERWGTTTPGSVVAGQQYTVTASGTWSPAAGTTADAVCVDTDQGQQQPRDEYGRRLWRLSLDGLGLRAPCSADHTYTWTITAQRSGPLVLEIDGLTPAERSGYLDVVLNRVPSAS